MEMATEGAVLSLNNGRMLPVLGLGTWLLRGKEGESIIASAIEMGYRHIDTAPIYSNEEAVGQAIRSYDRSSLYITSKLWIDHLSSGKVEASFYKTIEQLNTEYLDLLLIHWPIRSENIKDTLMQMQRLQESGQLISIGVSNFTVRHLRDALDSGVEIAVNQVEFHPFLNQEELLQFSLANGIATVAYAPLAGGLVASDITLCKIGERHQKTAAQVALRWLVQKGLGVVPKSASLERLRQNAAIFDFSLSQNEMSIISSLHTGNRVYHPHWADFEYI